MTNVKAGDLAIVKSTKPQYDGKIVEVLYPAPAGEFRLPNGQAHNPVKRHPSWVLKCIGSPILAPMASGRFEPVWYGVGEDKYLRPLPGDRDDSEIDEESPVTVRANDG